MSQGQSKTDTNKNLYRNLIHFLSIKSPLQSLEKKMLFIANKSTLNLEERLD